MKKEIIERADGSKWLVPETIIIDDGKRDLKLERPLVTSIPWNQTELCCGFHCACGQSYHVDGTFDFYVECGACGQVYYIPLDVKPELLTAEHASFQHYQHEHAQGRRALLLTATTDEEQRGEPYEGK